MPAKKSFPGQTPKSVFTLEQAKSLSSAIRSEVFWSFNKTEPLAVAEVASALGKSAQTVHYHTNELVRAGLLLAVDTRRRRARTEALYVHSSMNFVGQGPKAPKEFREYALKSFAAITRAMVREEAALQRVYDLGDDKIAPFSAYRRASIRLSPEDAVKLRERLYAVLDEAYGLEQSGTGIRVNFSVFMKPTQAESKLWAARVRSTRRPTSRSAKG